MNQKGFTPSPKEAQRFSQRLEITKVKEMKKQFFLNKIFHKKTDKSCSASLVRGFTLLELLIVIAILAVLSTVVILVLNPGEYLAQARDSQRISDLSTLNSAIALYISSAGTISLGTCGSTIVCTGGTASSSAEGGAALCTSINASTTIGGAGWVPINFGGLPGGSPISREPIDPTNNATLHYAYGCNATANTYKLAAQIESVKYGSTQQNIAGKDGGVSATGYEVGTDLTLFN